MKWVVLPVAHSGHPAMTCPSEVLVVVALVVAGAGVGAWTASCRLLTWCWWNALPVVGRCGKQHWSSMPRYARRYFSRSERYSRQHWSPRRPRTWPRSRAVAVEEEGEGEEEAGGGEGGDEVQEQEQEQLPAEPRIIGKQDQKHYGQPCRLIASTTRQLLQGRIQEISRCRQLHPVPRSAWCNAPTARGPSTSRQQIAISPSAKTPKRDPSS